MVIKKGNKMYTVTEQKTQWLVKLEGSSVELSIRVMKELCATLDELREYVLNNDFF